MGKDLYQSYRGLISRIYKEPKELDSRESNNPIKMRYSPLLGRYSEDSSACNKDTCSIMFIAALFVVARSWKEPRCPSMEEWIQKMGYIYTMEYYSAIRNNEFMKFLDKWIELENIILSEVTQSQKINHGMHSLISGY